MLFSTPAFAQDVAAQPGMFSSLMPLILMILIFWFLVIRPQTKRAKAHREKINNMQRGDTVITRGGLIGKVTKVKDDNEIEIEIAENTRVRIIKTMLEEVQSKNTPKKPS